LFVVVPATVAVNGSVPEVSEEAVAGEIVMEVTVGVGVGPAGLTLICAEFALSPVGPTVLTT
jgi:hypothetical protein